MEDKSQSLIPRGIEVLVKKASVDPEFKSLLLRLRSQSAASIELELDRNEALMLDTVPADQLEKIIAQTNVPQEHRRAFLGSAAAAMLAAIGVVSVTGCEHPFAAGGSRPPDPPREPAAKDSDSNNKQLQRPDKIPATTGSARANAQVSSATRYTSPDS